jgi:hypothetical protein
MDNRIRDLLDKIAVLENELHAALHERESRVLFTIRGKHVEFERGIREAHRKLKRNFFRWLVTDRWQNLITGPIIYAMAIPLALLDLTITFYQATCFPVYGVRKVRRADYIVFDRHQLGYLNFIERIHCEYCAYGTGLIAYATEILARTEEYFCPIKHARKIVGTHNRYDRFLQYGESADFHARLEAYRVGLGAEQADTKQAGDEASRPDA